ncbi:MAG TPA: amidophosphoribosyltransferase [Candidatus Marinimicrobia bacterium]|nr:amidophosphoribosyltransferase [Candidatus Neomarinimicrobiota bacterium]
MCGIVGIYNHSDASTLAYFGLFALQHRGQEGVGITTYNDSKFYTEKERGLVSEVFANKQRLQKLPGNVAIGHNRYSTHGEKATINIQPLVFNYKGNKIAIVHNGNLINLDPIRKQLEEKGTIFQTTSDTEYIIHLIAHSQETTIEDKILDALRSVDGAYSLVIMFNDKMIIARDKYGFRPLCMGRLDGAAIFASETCALDLIGAKYERDVNPGEMIVLDGKAQKVFKIDDPHPRHCIFEYVYFSRPDSRIFGEYVDKTRRKIGKTLAINKPVEDADIVISVPDSSNTIALGYSQRSNARFEIGLIRNHYIGRTFIHPDQKMRDFGVKIKFNTIGGVLNQKKVVIVDDSIVRGTTLKKLIRLIREAEPSELHVRIGSPPVKYPCFYGMDFPSKEELIANQKEVAQIKEYLEVDSLEYITVKGLLDSTSLPADHFCTACFTGKYLDSEENY